MHCKLASYSLHVAKIHYLANKSVEHCSVIIDIEGYIEATKEKE